MVPIWAYFLPEKSLIDLGECRDNLTLTASNTSDLCPSYMSILYRASADDSALTWTLICQVATEAWLTRYMLVTLVNDFTDQLVHAVRRSNRRAGCMHAWSRSHQLPSVRSCPVLCLFRLCTLSTTLHSVPYYPTPELLSLQPCSIARRPLPTH